jgi:hypothetical protein
MKEDFLHFLWQFQQFNKTDLQTIAGESIQIIKTGQHNHDAGPDFQNAKIVINSIVWAGNVEIHLRSADWELHQHQSNRAYENVILHVVWEHNKPIFRQDGSEITTIELKSRTNFSLIKEYESILSHQGFIPCEAHFKEVNNLAKIAMLDKALSQRLEQKANTVAEIWQRNKQDFEETAYQLLGKNFGFKINSEIFARLTENLPLKILQKHSNSIFQIEALLFGQAGFLDDALDEYSTNLKQEYDFLAEKYQLKPNKLEKYQWKFLRLRPANFPTIRIAQFAQIIQEVTNFYSFFTETLSFKELSKNLQIQQSEYWQQHYIFGEESNDKVGSIGKASIQNIVINTVIPLLAFTAVHYEKEILMERAIQFLEQLPPENNHITEKWKNTGLGISNAFDSQASLELYHRFCSTKQCLKCQIGITILKH